jgi:exonuclease III
MRRSRQRQGRPPLPLRVATHNVHGLTSPQKVNNLLRSWAKSPPTAQRPHILCLQETWLDTPHHPSQHEAAAWIYSACTDPALAGLQLAPPTCLCASNVQDGGAHYAGVVIILLRAIPGLLIHLAPSGAHPSGRLLHCIVGWGGHLLSFVNTYWPIGHGAQRNYRDQVLLPHLPHCLRASLLLVGDFNNVPDAAADRMFTVGSNRQLTPRWRSEERVAAELVAALAHADAPVADAYRHFYPAAVKQGFTHAVGTSTAARLDRIYAATDLLPSLLSIDSAAPNGFSNHVAVTVALVPRSARPPSCTSQGNRRVSGQGEGATHPFLYVSGQPPRLCLRLPL